MSEKSNKAHASSALWGKPIPRRTETILLAALALLFVTLTITSFVQKSPTVDEPLHLFAGYSYLKWGDLWVNPEHPPLAKMLAALSLFFVYLWSRVFCAPEAPPAPAFFYALDPNFWAHSWGVHPALPFAAFF